MLVNRYNIAMMLQDYDIARLWREIGEEHRAAGYSIDGRITDARHINTIVPPTCIEGINHLPFDGGEIKICRRCHGCRRLTLVCCTLYDIMHLIATVVLLNIKAQQTVGLRMAVFAQRETRRSKRVGLLMGFFYRYHILLIDNILYCCYHPFLCCKTLLETVDKRCIVVGLLHHLAIGIARDILTQRGKSDKDSVKDNQYDGKNTNSDKKIETRQLEGKLLFECLAIHDDKAMLRLGDLLYLRVKDFEPATCPSETYSADNNPARETLAQRPSLPLGVLSRNLR